MVQTEMDEARLRGILRDMHARSWEGLIHQWEPSRPSAIRWSADPGFGSRIRRSGGRAVYLGKKAEMSLRSTRRAKIRKGAVYKRTLIYWLDTHAGAGWV